MKRAQKGFLKRSLLQAVFILFVGVLAGRGESAPSVQGRISWYRWTEGVLAGAKQKRPLLVYFHKPYCEYCDKMDAETFADARVQEMIRSCFVPVRVESFDRTSFPGPKGEKLSGVALRQRYRVATYPTIVVLDFQNQGKEVLRIPGFFGPGEFLELMGYVTQGWFRQMSFGEFLERLIEKTLPQKVSGAGCWTGGLRN